jgi:hypothetical protein
VEDVVDFMWESGGRVDRFRASRFMGLNMTIFRLRQATFLEEDRHGVIANDVTRYFDCVKDHLGTISSMFA